MERKTFKNPSAFYFRTLFLMGVILLMGVNLVSAWEFDNVKRFDSSSNTLTIKNSILGIDWLSLDKVADIQFLGKRFAKIIAGTNKPILEFEVTAYEDYGNIFGGGKFTDLKKEYELNRNWKVYEKVITGKREVEDYYETYDKITKKDIKHVTGSHYEDIIAYKEITGMKKGEIKTIVVFTDVKPDDIVDFIPQWFGLYLEEFVPFVGYVNVALNKTNLKGNGTILEVGGYCTHWGSGCDKIIDGSLTIPGNKWDSYASALSNITIKFDKNYTVVDVEYVKIIAAGTSSNQLLKTYYQNKTGHWVFLNNSYANSTYKSYNISVADKAMQAIKFVGIGDGGQNWHITELRVYGKSLDSPPVVTLDSPPSGTYYTTTSVRMNCSAIDETQVKNISLYMDGAIINVSHGSLTWLNLSYFKTGITNGNHTWTCKAIDNLNQPSWAATNYSFNVTYSTLSITTTLRLPIDLIETQNQTITLYGNFTAYSGNLTNATAYVWAPTGILHQKNYTLIDGSNNFTSRRITGLTPGSNYKWNYYACAINGTATLCDWADTNRSFDVVITINSESYATNVSETQNQTFTINTTIPLGTSLYAAKFVYNGTQYSVTPIQETPTIYRLTKSIDTPNVVGYTNTTNFHWTFIYPTSGGYNYGNSTTRHQTVKKLIMAKCNSTIKFQSLNFTNYDEGNLSRLKPFDFEGTFTYWLGSGTITKNISISNSSSIETLMCLENQNLTYKSDATIQYERNGWTKRSYYLNNATLINNSNKINLYSLYSTDATAFLLVVQDKNLIGLKDAYIYIQRYYPGTGLYGTIAIAKTDENGKSVAYLEKETTDYRFIIQRYGAIIYTSETKKIICEETPCTLTFIIQDTTIDLFSSLSGLSSLTYNLSYAPNSRLFYFTYIDLTGTATQGRLLVTLSQAGKDDSVLCNITSTAIADTLTCNTTLYVGTFEARAFMSRSPEHLVDFITYTYNALKDIFGDSGLLIALFVLMVIGLVGLWNPAVGIVLMVFGIITISIMGLASFSYLSIIAIIIIALVVIIKLKT